MSVRFGIKQPSSYRHPGRPEGTIRDPGAASPAVDLRKALRAAPGSRLYALARSGRDDGF